MSRINTTKRRSDERIGADAVIEANWGTALVFADCKASRHPASGCPNGGKCRDKFLTNSVMTDAVMALRRALHVKGKKRSDLLYNELIAFKRNETLEFVLGEQHVCKTFYRLASGLRRQLFEEGVKRAIGNVREVKAARSKPVVKRKSSAALAAMDIIFSSKSIKRDPTRANLKTHTRTRWTTIYNSDYKQLVPADQQVSYNQFVSLRRNYRPKYVKCPRMKKGMHV